MTALIFFLNPQQVCIAMDTLATSQDYKAAFYTSKIFQLPHLGMAMCGTGIQGFVADWFSQLVKGFVARDVSHLDQFIPISLRKMITQHNIDQENTVTAYHFGFSENDFCFKGYAYRSINNFDSEQLQYGIGVKPAPIDPSGIDAINSVGGFIQLIERLRLEQITIPVEERVFIGGEIHFLLMNPSENRLFRCHKFDDYEIAYGEMLKNL